MARMSIDDKFLRDPRVTQLALELGISRWEAMGRLLAVFAVCYDLERDVITPAQVDLAADRPGLADALFGVDLAVTTRRGLRIRGVKKRIEYLAPKREAGRQGGIKSGESRRNSAKQKRANREATVNPPDPVPDPAPDPVPEDQKLSLPRAIPGDGGQPGSGGPGPRATQQGAATPGQGASPAAGSAAEPQLDPTGHRVERPQSPGPSGPSGPAVSPREDLARTQGAAFRSERQALSPERDPSERERNRSDRERPAMPSSPGVPNGPLVTTPAEIRAELDRRHQLGAPAVAAPPGESAWHRRQRWWGAMLEADQRIRAAGIDLNAPSLPKSPAGTNESNMVRCERQLLDGGATPGEVDAKMRHIVLVAEAEALRGDNRSRRWFKPALIWDPERAARAVDTSLDEAKRSRPVAPPAGRRGDPLPPAPAPKRPERPPPDPVLSPEDRAAIAELADRLAANPHAVAAEELASGRVPRRMPTAKLVQMFGGGGERAPPAAAATESPTDDNHDDQETA